MLQEIVQSLVGSVNGARGAIFLDGDGESVVQCGTAVVDMRLLGAWQEIHFDRIRDITKRLGLGTVNAVLFSQEEGNALMVPVEGEYALLLFLSTFSDLQDALNKLRDAVAKLQVEIR